MRDIEGDFVAQGHGIVKGDTHQKLSGVGFVIGAVLIIIGSLLLPRAIDLGDVQAMQKAYGEQATLLQACALLLTFGFLAVMMGTSGIYQSITKDGSAWVRLGFYFHLVGVALWMVGMSMDISYPAAIINWLEAPAASKEVANNDVYRARSPDLRLCSFYAAEHRMVADLWHLGHPKSMVTETKTRTNRCLVLNNIIIEAKDRILAYTTQL